MNKFHTRFNKPLSAKVLFLKPSRVQPQFKTEADINFLVHRLTRTGSFYSPEVMAKVRARPQFGDFVQMSVTSVVDAHTIIARAKESFEALPFAIRERFNNSPENFLRFMSDEKNVEEAIKLGLMEKKVETPSQVVETPSQVVVTPSQEVAKKE